MTAGAAAAFVVVGGGAAGVTTLLTPGTESATAIAADEPDLGAPRLEDDPEVVSRAAAAAQPLPKRAGETPVNAVKPPVGGAKPPVPTRAAAAAAPAARTPARTATTADQLSRARVADEPADRTGPRSTRTTAGKVSKPASGEARREPVAQPVVTTRTDVETRAIPFDTQVVRDSRLPRGTREVQSDGTPGEETLRYLVTLTDGRPTARRLLGSSVTKEPQNRVVALGSRNRPFYNLDCEHALHLCLPFGRSAVCPPEATRRQAPEATGAAREQRLEPTSRC